jgi:hypothetical protein
MDEHAAFSEQVSLALQDLFELSRDAPPVRENEIVNWFALDCLQSHLAPGRPLYSIAQVGIEVAVPQTEGRGGSRKYPDVRKDLVVWRRPRSACWSKDTGHPVHWPLAVLEFKVASFRDKPADVRRKLRSERNEDIGWLQEAVRHDQRLLGFSVAVHAPDTPWAIDVTRVSSDGPEHNWWTVNDGAYGLSFVQR